MAIYVKPQERIRRSFHSMLDDSRKEFNKWKARRRENSLRKACGKLYAAAVHYVELKNHIRITQNQFRKEFKKIKGYEKYAGKCDALHKFAGCDLAVIEKKYLFVYHYLENYGFDDYMIEKAWKIRRNGKFIDWETAKLIIRGKNDRKLYKR